MKDLEHFNKKPESGRRVQSLEQEVKRQSDELSRQKTDNRRLVKQLRTVQGEFTAISGAHERLQRQTRQLYVDVGADRSKLFEQMGQEVPQIYSLANFSLNTDLRKKRSLSSNVPRRRSFDCLVPVSLGNELFADDKTEQAAAHAREDKA